MSWAFDPSAWVDGTTIPTAADFRHIAADIHTWGANVDAGANWLTNCAALAGLGGNGILQLNPSGGFVGVGVASPLATFHIAGALTHPAVFANGDFGQLHIAGNEASAVSHYAKITFSNVYSGSGNGQAAIGVMFDGTGSWLRFGTSNSYGSGVTCTAMTIDPNGNCGINTASPTISGTGKFHHSGDTARIVDASNTPANSAAAGNDGEVRMDNSYVYCHTGGSWRRAALSTF